MSIWTFILNHLDQNIHATIKKITWINMLGSIPHQKFCFCHLPTRGRAWIKLGDAWYVSNVSIIFDCSMLLYYPFWMFMGFTLHFYIIFGTNLLTEGPVQIDVFFLFQCFGEKEYQTEWNLRESYFWNKHDPGGLGVDVKKQSRRPWGREHSRGPLVAPSTYFFLLYIYSYTLKSSGRAMKPLFHCRNHLYPWDPILGPFPALRRRGIQSRRASTSTP